MCAGIEADIALSCPLDLQEAQEALGKKVEELAAIEADVENMRKTMSKGGKKGRKQGVPAAKGAAKGFAQPVVPTPNPATATPTKADAGAEHLRDELKQAQVRMSASCCRMLVRLA